MLVLKNVQGNTTDMRQPVIVQSDIWRTLGSPTSCTNNQCANAFRDLVTYLNLVDRRIAQPYTQPTPEKLFPFLMLEVKSEASGGGLNVAENQAVGSGVYSVRSLRWLITQAFASEVPATTDAVASTGAVSPRAAVFCVVWWSEKRHRYIMPKFRNVSFMEGPEGETSNNSRTS